MLQSRAHRKIQPEDNQGASTPDGRVRPRTFATDAARSQDGIPSGVGLRNRAVVRDFDANAVAA